MGKTVIKFGLSSKEIDRAIKEVEQYKRDLISKTNLLRERIAERIADNTQSGFSGAIADDRLKGGKKYAEVTVELDKRDNITVVIANGEDAVWVEFGAGVFHNGAVGTSLHPKGAELGFTIGSYGKGYGKQTVWGYRDENGNLRLTHGTPAVMPMYNAVKTVMDEIVDIAREVFQ